MNKYINSVNIEYEAKTNSLFITIEDTEETTTEITRNPSKNGVFSFQYKHPERNKKESYKGFLYGKEISIYPLYGIGFLSDEPIKYKMV